MASDARAVAQAAAGAGSSFDFSMVLSVADSLPVMVAFVGSDLTYGFINKPFAEWFEAERSDLLGKSVQDVMPTAMWADRKPRIEAALAGERQLFTAPFDHPTRGALFVRAEYVPQPSPDGKGVSGIVMIIQDITEQRLTERALRESEERFRRIADSAPVPMWVTRSDGSRDFVNQAYHDFFGFELDERGQHDWQTAIHPDDRDLVLAAYKKGMASADPVELVGRFKRADGEWRWLRSVSMPRFGPDGSVAGFIGTASDVTAAKESELALQRLVDERTADLEATQDQLRQAQKMEALGQLTGGIAHDFNNLLTVVVGGLDLISKRVEDERLLRYAQSALQAAERGARLTAQLLAFSRVQRLEVRPTYVSPMMEEMRPLLRNVLGPGIEKTLDLDPHLMPVMADPTQLEVAVLNLAINARDAMPDGGTLTITSQKRRIGDDPELEPGDYIELSIRDTGTGMPPDVAARAFEPFFTTKEVGKGTGLGLSMVYGMARQSGGTARIVSEIGKGTTVSLLLRRADRDGEVPLSGGRSGDAMRRENGHYRILVIDDDDEVRASIASTLEEYGHDVTEAADGAAGLARFGDVKPDLVVLDYVMPGMSGADVARAIRADTPDQPILFVSGYNETDAIRAVAPDAPLLAKPFRPSALEEAVREAMRETA